MSKGRAVKNASRVDDVSQGDDLLCISTTLIEKLYGKPAQAILDHLVKNEYLAEEKLLDDTNVRSNEGRKILQKMADEAIVTPDRIRVDVGVLHVWRLNRPALKTFILGRLKKAREKLEVLLNHELENVIYRCQSCGRRYTVDEAYTHGFQCPQDGDILSEASDQGVINTIRDIISKLDYLVSKIEQA
ncbi:MAG: transcription factor TFIIE [Desulfurococcaceae archaeon]